MRQLLHPSNIHPLITSTNHGLFFSSTKQNESNEKHDIDIINNIIISLQEENNHHN